MVVLNSVASQRSWEGLKLFFRSPPPSQEKLFLDNIKMTQKLFYFIFFLKPKLKVGNDFPPSINVPLEASMGVAANRLIKDKYDIQYRVKYK